MALILYVLLSSKGSKYIKIPKLLPYFFVSDYFMYFTVAIMTIAIIVIIVTVKRRWDRSQHT